MIRDPGETVAREECAGDGAHCPNKLLSYIIVLLPFLKSVAKPEPKRPIRLNAIQSHIQTEYFSFA